MMTKNEKLNMRLRYERFQQYEPFFTFEPKINNKEDLYRLYNEEVSVTHKDCGRTESIVISKWMSLHSVNKGVPKERYLYLCNYCSREIRNEIFQKKLDEVYKGDFLLVDNYNGKKEACLIKHNSCGGIFSIVGESVERSRLMCKVCKKSDIYYETEKQEEKNSQLKNELKNKGFENFIPITNFEAKNKPVTFKHLTCGETFEKTPQLLLKLKNKDRCPKCLDGKARSKDQTERNEYFQGKMNQVNGKKYILISNYKGQNTVVTVKHIKCNNEFPIYSEMLIREEYKCPHCESKNIKNNKYISLKEKIEVYEKMLNNEYKILTPFVSELDTVSIKHRKCEHIFERTMVTFLRSKGKILCPECQNKKRLDDIEKKLHKKYNDEYKILNIRTTAGYKKIVEVMHSKCKNSFETNLHSLLSNNISHCPHCSHRINSTSKLKGAVFNKYKGEYIVLSEYHKSSVDIYFRHVKCGHKFKMTSRKFMDYVTPCPNCRKKKKRHSIEKAQEKVNEVFGNLFTLCGIYVNVNTEMPIKCNACGKVLDYSVNNLLKRKACPSCKTRKL